MKQTIKLNLFFLFLALINKLAKGQTIQDSNLKSDLFFKINVKSVNKTYEMRYVIKSLTNLSKVECVVKCNSNSNCKYMLFETEKKTCVLCKNTVINYFNIGFSNSQEIYQKYNQYASNKSGLLNYWQFDSSLNDIVGEVNMYGSANTIFTNDRFNRPLSAISLNTEYLNISASDFFGTGKFTIMAWVKVRNYNSWSRLVDFGMSGLGSYDDIAFAFTYGNNGIPQLLMHTNTTLSLSFTKTMTTLTKGVWQHLTCTFEFPKAYIYVNGSKEMIGTSPSPITTEIRDSNYLGRSWKYPSDTDANADIDDLKIFNRALSQQEILDEMNS